MYINHCLHHLELNFFLHFFQKHIQKEIQDLVLMHLYKANTTIKRECNRTYEMLMGTIHCLKWAGPRCMVAVIIVRKRQLRDKYPPLHFRIVERSEKRMDLVHFYQKLYINHLTYILFLALQTTQ